MSVICEGAHFAYAALVPFVAAGAISALVQARVAGARRAPQVVPARSFKSALLCAGASFVDTKGRGLPFRYGFGSPSNVVRFPGYILVHRKSLEYFAGLRASAE